MLNKEIILSELKKRGNRTFICCLSFVSELVIYFASSIIISLLLLMNLVIFSGANGWCQIVKLFAEQIYMFAVFVLQNVLN